MVTDSTESAQTQPISASVDAGATPHIQYSMKQLVLYVLKLGTIGFGGPVALVGYMHRDLVERRRWISEDEYKEGLALAQLMPGPLAAQLAIYLGFVHYRVLGATLVGIAFVLPSFLMVVALGWAYRHFGGLAWTQAVFYGVGSAVIGIIALSAYKLTRKSIKKDWLLWTIYLATATVTVVTESETVWVFLGAGVLYWAVKTDAALGLVRKLAHRAPCFAVVPFAGTVPLAASTETGLFTTLFLFFAKAGAFVFGSGLAIVPFLYGGVVKEHQWLNDRQFLDAVAVAMITPGPVVITVAFIGFLIAGFWGAVVAALATFLPCYLLTVLPAPYFKRFGKLPSVVAFVDGVTAAAIGAITGAVIVLGKRSVYDLPTAAIAGCVLIVLWRFQRLPEPLVVLAAALVGLGVYPLTHH